MGVNQLSKLIKSGKQGFDSFVDNDLLRNKRLGVDLSVILHKALGNEVSAGEFQIIPAIPISKVKERCWKLISLAKQGNITLVICIDGNYHCYKSKLNENRKPEQLKYENLLNGTMTGQVKIAKQFEVK